MMRRSHQVTANVEKVADESVHGQEALRLTGRFEPSHVSLALSCGLVGDFGAIVLVSVRAMGDRRHDRSVRCPVAAQLVGDQPPRLTLLALQQLAEKACGRSHSGVWLSPLATRRALRQRWPSLARPPASEGFWPAA